MDDPKAFEELVVRYQGVVCAVAYAILRDRARSEEVAQEAFLIAWQKLPAITPPPQLPAWVCGIARNLARNAARRPKEMPMHEATEPTTTANNPVEQMLDRERQQLADRALAELAESDREAIVLYYRGDGSIADVAATLGITETAARQRVHRGRERLKSALTSVETSLRATRPSHAFTAACVAALAAGGSSTASAATTATKTTNKLWIAAPIVAVLVGGGAVAVAVSSNSSSDDRSERTPVLATVVADAHAAVVDSAYIKRIDRAGRTTMIDKIHEAQRTRIAQLGGEAVVKTYDFSGDVLGPVKPNVPPPDPSKLGKATMRYAIRDIQPLLLECYSDAFDRLARKDGTLEVKLVLIGEPGLATLVDDVELGGDAHLTKDAAFVECMRETLYTIEMPEMTGAETWNVNYPFMMPGTR